LTATRGNTAKRLLVGLIIAILFTLIPMLAIAALMIALPLSDQLIKTINQFIKVIAIILGTIAAVPKGAEKGLVSGVLIALVYTILGYVCYLSLGGGCYSFIGMMGELLIGVAAGAVSGAIRANLNPKTRHKPKIKTT